VEKKGEQIAGKLRNLKSVAPDGAVLVSIAGQDSTLAPGRTLHDDLLAAEWRQILGSSLPQLGGRLVLS